MPLSRHIMNNYVTAMVIVILVTTFFYLWSNDLPKQTIMHPYGFEHCLCKDDGGNKSIEETTAGYVNSTKNLDIKNKFPNKLYNTFSKVIWGNNDPFIFAKNKYLSSDDELFGMTHVNAGLIKHLIKHFYDEQIKNNLNKETETNELFLIEGGSFIGGSAITTADTIKQLNIPSTMICIDPFTAVLLFHIGTKAKPFAAFGKYKNVNDYLMIDEGNIRVYDHFIANIKHYNHDDIILPIINTADMGFKIILKMFQKNIIFKLPDIIYLDSSHEEDNVYFELISAFNLLTFDKKQKNNSDTSYRLLWGDDYQMKGVSNAIKRFTYDFKVKVPIDPTSSFSIENLINGYNGIRTALNNSILLWRSQWMIIL